MKAFARKRIGKMGGIGKIREYAGKVYWKIKQRKANRFAVSKKLAASIRNTFPGFEQVKVIFGYTTRKKPLIIAEGFAKISGRDEYRCAVFNPRTGEHVTNVKARALKASTGTVIVSFHQEHIEIPQKMQGRGILNAIVAHTLAFYREKKWHVIVPSVETPLVKKILVQKYGAVEKKDGVEWLPPSGKEKTLPGLLSAAKTTIFDVAGRQNE